MNHAEDIIASRAAVREARVRDLELGERYDTAVNEHEIGAITEALKRQGARGAASAIRSLWDSHQRGQAARNELAAIKQTWWYRLFNRISK